MCSHLWNSHWTPWWNIDHTLKKEQFCQQSESWKKYFKYIYEWVILKTGCRESYFGVLLFLFSMFLQVTEEWIYWCTKLLCCGDDHPHVSFWITQDHIELSFFWNHTITTFVLKGTWVPQGEKYFRPGPWTGFDGVLHIFSLAATKKLPLSPTFKF